MLERERWACAWSVASPFARPDNIVHLVALLARDEVNRRAEELGHGEDVVRVALDVFVQYGPMEQQAWLVISPPKRDRVAGHRGEQEPLFDFVDERVEPDERELLKDCVPYDEAFGRGPLAVRLVHRDVEICAALDELRSNGLGMG